MMIVLLMEIMCLIGSRPILQVDNCFFKIVQIWTDITEGENIAESNVKPKNGLVVTVHNR